MTSLQNASYKELRHALNMRIEGEGNYRFLKQESDVLLNMVRLQKTKCVLYALHPVVFRLT